jgi:hypothetical protein
MILLVEALTGLPVKSAAKRFVKLALYSPLHAIFTWAQVYTVSSCDQSTAVPWVHPQKLSSCDAVTEELFQNLHLQCRDESAVDVRVAHRCLQAEKNQSSIQTSWHKLAPKSSCHHHSILDWVQIFIELVRLIENGNIQINTVFKAVFTEKRINLPQ